MVIDVLASDLLYCMVVFIYVCKYASAVLLVQEVHRCTVAVLMAAIV